MDLYLPDTNNILRSINELLYNDIDVTTNEMNFVDPSLVNMDLARSFGIRMLSSIISEEVNEDLTKVEDNLDTTSWALDRIRTLQSETFKRGT